MDIEEYKKRFYNKVKTNADIEWERIVKLIDGKSKLKTTKSPMNYKNASFNVA